ncbi:kynureninase [Syncephalis fuscata]|nr:kynureninase [Syncephalis fuscata]
MASTSHPVHELEHVAHETGLNMLDSAFATAMDKRDSLTALRQEFIIPKAADGKESVYLCGNSLGALPKRAKQLVQEELEVWANEGVLGHSQHAYGRPWITIDEHAIEQSAKLVGANPLEVAIMGTLTVNLHLLMVSFYRPTPKRFKIMFEKKAFPSDIYAISSQIQMHGFNPRDGMLMLEPREGEHTLRPEDILSAIEEHGDEVALIMFPGVQFYTGQLFDMPSITRAGHAKGCYVGFDLAHAIGNVPLALHEWDVDFAAWCSYKYLNSGAGGIGGIYVHEKHTNSSNLPRLSGWWSNDTETRFEMAEQLKPSQGAAAYRISNTPALSTASLIENKYGISIITPRSPDQRGCQLSVLFKQDITTLFDALLKAGVICDERKPNCIRLAPVPLYNRFTDVYQAVAILDKLLEAELTAKSQ